jgi:hypothetical protein
MMIVMVMVVVVMMMMMMMMVDLMQKKDVEINIACETGPKST